MQILQEQKSVRAFLPCQQTKFRLVQRSLLEFNSPQLAGMRWRGFSGSWLSPLSVMCQERTLLSPGVSNHQRLKMPLSKLG